MSSKIGGTAGHSSSPYHIADLILQDLEDHKMCSIMGYCDVCTDTAAFAEGFDLAREHAFVAEVVCYAR